MASRAAGLPVPGAVLGLLLLLGWFVVRGGPDAEMRGAANTLLGNLTLFFVPAGVGIVTQLDVIGRNWVAIAVATLVSTALGLAVTALVMTGLSRGGADPAP